VIQHPFKNFTAQKTFTLEQASNDWILFLDADEVVPDQLGAEIIKKVNTPTEIAAFWFYRKFMFGDKRLKFSGWQTDKNYMFLKPSWKFFHHYILRLGILDGKKGIIICYLNALCDFEKYRELRKIEQRNQLVYYLEMP